MHLCAKHKITAAVYKRTAELEVFICSGMESVGNLLTSVCIYTVTLAQ